MSQASLMLAYDEAVSLTSRGRNHDEIAAFRLPDATVERVRDLLRKNSEGTLTPDEADELDQCVQLDQLVSLIRSRSAANRQGSTSA